MTLFPVAAADRAGEAEFVAEHTGQMGHLAGRVPRAAKPLVIVQTARIDDLALDHGIGRIDLIEDGHRGAERQALPGMARLLASSRPIVICEWHSLVAGPNYEAAFEPLCYTCELLEVASRSEPFHLLARPSIPVRRHDEG